MAFRAACYGAARLSRTGWSKQALPSSTQGGQRGEQTQRVGTDNLGIVQRARQGDLFAFQSLMDRYQGPLFRYLYRLVNDAEAARRLTQDTFLTGRKNLDKTNEEMRFEVWLYRIATRLALQEIGRRRLFAWGRRAGNGHKGPSWGEDYGEGEAIQQLLSKVPGRELACLLLRSMEGFSLDEIALMLGMSSGKVAQCTARARATLRTLGAANGKGTL